VLHEFLSHQIQLYLLALLLQQMPSQYLVFPVITQ
jgi:hypothetical protein